MILALFDRLKGYLFAAGAALAVIGGAYMKGRVDRKRELEAERQKERLRAIQQRKDVDDEVGNLGASDLDERYREWLRDTR